MKGKVVPYDRRYRVGIIDTTSTAVLAQNDDENRGKPDGQEIKDLNLEQMFEVFDAADKSIPSPEDVQVILTIACLWS